MMAALKRANWRYYLQLMRLDKPIGTYLLLWPTWWALWLAAEGVPPLHLLLVFSAGVVLMRAAGCVINDYADRKWDGAVERTKQRPLASGAVSGREALQLFVLLLALSASLLVFLNWQTVLLSVVAVLLASVYPFMKRYTHLPQVVLGAAFSWGMPMAFMAVQLQLPPLLWLLYLANLLWTVAYDTYYALVDRPDDIKVGIKSTAILFGDYALPVIAALQLLALALLLAVGAMAALHWVYYLFLLLAAGCFVYQYRLAAASRQGCFAAFLHNHYVGMLVFAGIALSYLLQG
ncbi:MAG: 4-hydroxybenzoate octaprenyltransferase [Gammaproteobacteria bacterium]|nr:4-hydroxybenzoate octaprenyltransferase [Gammaproteobacteria bacterium]MBU1554831.1 4-hydroxybenzoate octaprenyltransferase [Gammaproteobacteria bacterium]MBU2070086.1 4-hydroxybenzoate octaprenyltransferase [Gammaproteobacteria bacterium]MBU2183618.1 4-hydroxybenzoate octaprenyltransferase [Gammaproteobacteria bacterium]MBU2205620.1 4-hydroxybenzoate octaprenyltransferase [Gammaproteobacteria bacterium]